MLLVHAASRSAWAVLFDDAPPAVTHVGGNTLLETQVSAAQRLLQGVCMCIAWHGRRLQQAAYVRLHPPWPV